MAQQYNGPPAIDFSPLGELYNTYRKGRAEADISRAREQIRANPGMGQDEMAKLLIGAGATQEGATLAGIYNQVQQRALQERTLAETIRQHDQTAAHQGRVQTLAEQQATAAARGFEIRERERPDGSGIKELVRIEKTTGKITPLDGGEGAGRAVDDSVVRIPPPPPGADQKEWRKLHTEGLYKAQEALPKAEASAGQMLKAIKNIQDDPYKKWATGYTSPLAKIGGTPLFDFNQKVEQLKGKAFLDAFEALKGGGAISETEGAKATAAMGRLHTAQTEKAFDEALKEIEEVVTTGLEVARQKAQAHKAAAKPGGAAADPAKSALDGIRANPAAALAEARATIAKNPATRDAIIKLFKDAGADTAGL